MRTRYRETFRGDAPACRTGRRFRRGFTLMESLMATGLLFGVVVSVTAAIVAGQQNALEAQQRIAATLAAEDLMGRLVDVHYDDLPTWHGHTEAVGTMTDIEGQPLPVAYQSIGRQVLVVSTLYRLEDLDINVRGREVTIFAFDHTDRVLAVLSRFVPEPAEDSLPAE